MIIFYNLKTGDISGTISGRVHPETHHNMSIGDEKENGKLVIEWKPITYYNKQGEVVAKDHPDAYTADFEINTDQKDLFKLFDDNPMAIQDYKVDLATLKLVKKE